MSDEWTPREAMFDCPLEWREASKACRILTTKSIDPTKGQQGNLTLRPHTVTLPQVLDCLATPMTKEEVDIGF